MTNGRGLNTACRARPAIPGHTAKDNRLIADAVLWILRTGNPWRDPRRIGQLAQDLCALRVLA